MFGRKSNRIEVVEASDTVKSPYASKKTMVAAALIPLAVVTPIVINRLTRESYTATSIPMAIPAIPATIPPPLQTPSIPATMMSNIQPINPTIPGETGFIADKSLEVLANVLDPLLQIMVAISFPIASVIMVGSCFHFMFGNNEKAWDAIMKAGLGYVLIQLSPLFLKILRQVGESVAA